MLFIEVVFSKDFTKFNETQCGLAKYINVLWDLANCKKESKGINILRKGRAMKELVCRTFHEKNHTHHCKTGSKIH